MSVLGSQLASSLAGTPLQQQQAARLRQAQEGNPQHEIRRVQELFESHLKALEESDQFESPAHLHVDGEPPDRQPSGQQQRGHPHGQAEAAKEQQDVAGDGSSAESASAADEDSPLYRHLDVQA